MYLACMAAASAFAARCPRAQASVVLISGNHLPNMYQVSAFVQKLTVKMNASNEEEFLTELA